MATEIIRLSQRRGMAATCGFAAVLGALLAFSSPLQAALVTHLENHTLTATPDSPNNIYNLDVDLNGVSDFKFTTIIGDPTDPTFASFSVVDHPFGSSNAQVVDALTGDGFPTIRRLHPGDIVGSSSLFSGPNDQGNLFFIAFPDAATGNFQDQTGYIGLRFARGSDTLYGFAQVTVNNLLAPHNPLAVTIGLVGYESVAGQSVQIPSSVPMPAAAKLGGVGLVLLVIARFLGNSLWMWRRGCALR